MADDGTIAFATPAALVSADLTTNTQDPTSGSDVYEWRDGRQLLVSDGLTNWADTGPSVGGVDSSGRDIFILAAAQYTPDALDGYRRLYDARIGGGCEEHEEGGGGKVLHEAKYTSSGAGGKRKRPRTEGQTLGPSPLFADLRASIERGAM